jgi:hypothetical protein
MMVGSLNSRFLNRARDLLLLAKDVGLGRTASFAKLLRASTRSRLRWIRLPTCRNQQRNTDRLRKARSHSDQRIEKLLEQIEFDAPSGSKRVCDHG